MCNILFFYRWARRGDIWEAADLMQQMKQEGVQPDIRTYTSLVNACCKAGDMIVCLLPNYSPLFILIFRQGEERL